LNFTSPNEKVRFSCEEDIILTKMVNEYGEDNWDKISIKMNKTKNQCRTRFFNYLSLKVNKAPWTSDEDVLLLQKVEELGNKWTLVSTLLNRTDVQCKNRVRKLQRKHKKYIELSKESELLNQTTTSQKVADKRFLSFFEECDIFEDVQWYF
jgi:hypothetical protein